MSQNASAAREKGRPAVAPFLSVVRQRRRMLRDRWQRERATARAGVHPVLLHEDRRAAEHHVELAAVGRRLDRAPRPGALVGVLVAAVVEPRITQRVGRRLLDLVREIEETTTDA